MPIKSKLQGQLLQLVAILFAIFPANWAYSSYQFLQTAITSEATITSERLSYGTSGAGSQVGAEVDYIPIAKYTVDSQDYFVEKKWLLEELEIGDTVSVKYQPDRPDDAKIHTFGEFWGMPLLLAGISIVIFLVGRSIK